MVRAMRPAKVALTDQQQEVLRLYRAKIPVRRIADLQGVSTQRVYQQLGRLEELGAIKRRR